MQTIMKIAITITAENPVELEKIMGTLAPLLPEPKAAKKPSVVYEGEADEDDEVETKKPAKKSAKKKPVDVDEDDADDEDVETKKTVKKSAKKKPVEVEDEDADDEDADDEDEDADEPEEIGLEEIRAVIQGLKDKTKTKPILLKFGVERVTALDKKHYAKFYEKIKALPQIKG